MYVIMLSIFKMSKKKLEFLLKVSLGYCFKLHIKF
jgi:hypothetical protein